uniref:RING-type E3 ubiquitin transferase n=1 Tax=Oreochromis aureus TaxID=47969 RepID=A0A668TB35_OREAU
MDRCKAIDGGNSPWLTVDKKLKDILKVTPGAYLYWYNKDNVGMLHKFMVKEPRLLWNGLLRTWTDNKRLLHEKLEAVPFLLEGLDNTEIRVLSPLPAAGLDKEVTYEKFHQVSHSLGDLVGQYFTGEKPKDQLEIEGILKISVGELNLDTDGTLSLRPPSNGSQYFLTPVDFDVIISALAGAAINFWAGLRYYRHCATVGRRFLSFQLFPFLFFSCVLSFFPQHSCGRSVSSLIQVTSSVSADRRLPQSYKQYFCIITKTSTIEGTMGWEVSSLIINIQILMTINQQPLITAH